MNERLFALLRWGLTENTEADIAKEAEELADGGDLENIVEIAAGHSVLPFLYEPMRKLRTPDALLRQVQKIAGKTVRQNYRLWLLSGQILAGMQEMEIPVVLLKGMATASLYPIPELRKSGDVDILLLDRERWKDAEEVLTSLGCRVTERQPALHHTVYNVTVGEQKNIEIELHTMLAEPFDNARVNELLDRQIADCASSVVERTVAGIPVRMLDDAYHAYELLLHMLQHFLRSGFGLKLLCDWVVFWNRDVEEREKKKYLELVNECGIKRFSDLVTLTCIRYLGLRESGVEFMELDRKLSAEEFMKEITEAEEFGKSSKDRMVALRGNGITDYVREFHHQMHLNYPKAGRWVVLWPALWGMTLFRFLVNNRRVRKTSLNAILKKAGQRGKMMKDLQLFRQRY